MSTLLINNAEIVLEDTILKKHSVYCVNGKIKSITPSGEKEYNSTDETLDASGFFLAPGYIDLHIHGSRGILIDNGEKYIDELCRILPEYGVTGFLPTVTPCITEKDDLLLLDSLSQAKTEGASILGFFLEGHFIALTGAIANIPQNKTAVRVKELIEAAAPYKAVFAISPEVEDIENLIPLMTGRGYPAFITHTSANVKQTQKAIESGATHATHFYDVFPYPGNKKGGVRCCGAVEMILASPETSVDFILDGEHVDPVAVEMAIACKGRDKVCLITDANINAGLPPGKYTGIGNREIIVSYEGGPARLVKEGDNGPIIGGLAGSGLTMDRAVKNAVKLLGLDIPQAVSMASANPARVLGLHHNKGYIKEGYDADMIMLNKELNVVRCWVGQRSYFSI